MQNNGIVFSASSSIKQFLYIKLDEDNGIGGFKTAILNGDFNIPNYITRINSGGNSYYNTKFNGDFIFPKSVKMIGDYIFNGCSVIGNDRKIIYEGSQGDWGKIRFCNDAEQLTRGGNPLQFYKRIYFNNDTSILEDEFHFEEGTEIIRLEVLYNAVQFKRVYIPSSVHTIRAWAFNGMSSLNEIYFGGTITQYENIYATTRADSICNIIHDLYCIENNEYSKVFELKIKSNTSWHILDGVRLDNVSIYADTVTQSGFSFPCSHFNSVNFIGTLKQLLNLNCHWSTTPTAQPNFLFNGEPLVEVIPENEDFTEHKYPTFYKNQSVKLIDLKKCVQLTKLDVYFAKNSRVERLRLGENITSISNETFNGIALRKCIFNCKTSNTNSAMTV